MQSESPEISNSYSAVSPEQNLSQRQHGFHDPDAGSLHSLAPHGGRAEHEESLFEEDSLSSDPATFAWTDAPPPRRLIRRPSTKTRSPVGRIADYERVLTLSSNSKSHGPEFSVIRKPPQNNSAAVNLVDFPNEVLTHILSHLPPLALSAVSCVSRRFHTLVTTPHAWRAAFSRYFPGSDALSDCSSQGSTDEDKSLVSGTRVFSRLTTLASWRSEYILRTRLLRSLGRGRPAVFQALAASGSSRSSPGHTGNAQITYSSNLFTTVNHLHASFGTELNKNLPRFIHGADEGGSVSLSEPSNGKVDRWGFLDPHSFLQFVDRFPGDVQYGLGPGDMVGLPNSMDVSQKYGMVYAEGFPGGSVFFRSTEEQRGRFLAPSQSYSVAELGIPRLNSLTEAMCSIWISKSSAVPTVTEGLIGIMSGSSLGIITSYSLGTNNVGERRINRGEVTARWVLSPGVPIIAISVDKNVSTRRLAEKRVWAVALNALGEIFYLNAIPSRRNIDKASKVDNAKLDEIAWETGRTIGWTLIEPSRREAMNNPYGWSDIDGRYSPRGSWNGMGLSKDQLAAETHELERFLKEKPKHYRTICNGWDMRRRLEVDFAGNYENNDGEAIIVCCCGLDEETVAIKRYTRCRAQQASNVILGNSSASSLKSPAYTAIPSIFGGNLLKLETPLWAFDQLSPQRSSSVDCVDAHFPPLIVEAWRMSTFSFGGLKATQITTTAIDESKFSLLTVPEDALISLSGSSTTSSPMLSPIGKSNSVGSTIDIPGQRARFLAAGTKLGTVVVWDMRAPTSGHADIINTIRPIRIIHTDSPQISCLAVSALYLVHGGNDGLVQAWDPLNSTSQPIRTLNSRFSSRARRRLVQAEASVHGVGVNLFAAGAICLDPDPTILRGMVSLGTHLRYWSYSSSTADQYKSNKRHPRRSKRGSNQGGEKFTQTGRGALQDYIATEKEDLEREKEVRKREEARLAGRFGVDLLGPGASEDEIMAYATLLSEEAANTDEARRRSESETSEELRSNTIVTDIMSWTTAPSNSKDEQTEADIAEAIRLSLKDDFETDESVERTTDFTLKYSKRIRLPPQPSLIPDSIEGSSRQPDESDLDFAMQLSWAEEESRREVDEEFPILSKSPSPPLAWKGKERAP